MSCAVPRGAPRRDPAALCGSRANTERAVVSSTDASARRAARHRRMHERAAAHPLHPGRIDGVRLSWGRDRRPGVRGERRAPQPVRVPGGRRRRRVDHATRRRARAGRGACRRSPGPGRRRRRLRREHVGRPRELRRLRQGVPLARERNHRLRRRALPLRLSHGLRGLRPRGAQRLRGGPRRRPDELWPVRRAVRRREGLRARAVQGSVSAALQVRSSADPCVGGLPPMPSALMDRACAHTAGATARERTNRPMGEGVRHWRSPPRSLALGPGTRHRRDAPGCLRWLLGPSSRRRHASAFSSPGRATHVAAQREARCIAASVSR